MDLNFFISEKNSVVVASLAGALSKDTKGVIEECKQQILNIDAKHVILCFQDATHIDFIGAEALAQLQKSIRGIPAQLQLCMLPPQIKKLLFERGLIRREEIVGTLVQALKTVQTPLKA